MSHTVEFPLDESLIDVNLLNICGISVFSMDFPVLCINFHTGWKGKKEIWCWY